jgi:hypothetical protein
MAQLKARSAAAAVNKVSAILVLHHFSMGTPDSHGRARSRSGTGRAGSVR